MSPSPLVDANLISNAYDPFSVKRPFFLPRCYIYEKISVAIEKTLYFPTDSHNQKEADEQQHLVWESVCFPSLCYRCVYSPMHPLGKNRRLIKVSLHRFGAAMDAVYGSGTCINNIGRRGLPLVVYFHGMNFHYIAKHTAVTVTQGLVAACRSIIAPQRHL